MAKLKRLYIVLLVVGLSALGLCTYLAQPWIADYRTYLVLSQLADQGEPSHSRNLAEYFYERGEFESALKWELRSAEGGDPIAQNFMGLYFRYGINEHLRPTILDASKAREWFERAAAQDFQPSQAELCEIYSIGLGVSADPQTAYFWCSVSENNERTERFRKLASDALDENSRHHAERRTQEWITSHRANP